MTNSFELLFAAVSCAQIYKFLICDLKSKLEDRSIGLPRCEPVVEDGRDMNCFLLGDNGMAHKAFLKAALTRNERICSYRIIQE